MSNKLQFFKLVNKGNVWSFILLFLRHPLNVIPMFLATYQTVKISDKYYGYLHHKNNAANAFRHALWNFLIAKKCSKWRRNTRKAIKFAEKITDWHEEFSPNTPLEKEMDLHNNHIGRKMFIISEELPLDLLLERLKEKTEESKKIYRVEDLKKYNNDLVYIEDIDLDAI
ncbi:MAG: hypothetical protein CSA39_03305 [Flavobacteriales bacterium]|nr:MAG: hypothetical protein CR985_03305 [Flavobacteriales bacterium]PIE49315.1 MAG: hypothetical protein CSA39_03305 [Flavobacteriales bacterium]